MANSKYQYVRQFERDNFLLPETFIVVRIDGRGFHKFSAFYNFQKPNDLAALQCMNQAAVGVLKAVQDICIGYGDSDEYSFVFDPKTTLFERRESKLVSTVVSTFTACYIQAWTQLMPKHLEAAHLPTFDGRAVVYPNLAILRDYLSWRQADCHINNLYNTAFWALVQSGLSNQEAEAKLRGTLSSDKNEIMFKLGLNYNNEPEIYKKGTILVWSKAIAPVDASTLSASQLARHEKKQRKNEVEVLHCDLITNDEFWARFTFR